MIHKIALLITLMCSAPVLLAGTVSGTVSEDGEPLSRVAVTVIDADSSVIIGRALTDASGNYNINVKSGRYRLRASLKEYADVWIRKLLVTDGNANVDISMTPEVFIDSTAVPQPDDCD